MPKAPIIILIDGQAVDITASDELGISVSYNLEDPENFEQKQSNLAYAVTLPATPTNDKIFNSFHNPAMKDMTGSNRYKQPLSCEMSVGGVTFFKGKALLTEATHTRMPGKYTLNCYGCNGDWVLDMREMTLWDCLDNTPHTFDTATVEWSWSNYGDPANEHADFVYAPVRYRQMFGLTDDKVEMKHLRPSLSPYWMIKRAFRSLGYAVSSVFMETVYFRCLAMPWVWGDFYDINSDLLKIIGFKACGRLPARSMSGPVPPTSALTSNEYITNSNLTGSLIWTDYNTSETSFWFMIANTGGTIGAPGDYNILTYLGDEANRFPTEGLSNVMYKWQIDNTDASVGWNNSNNYSFDEANGYMNWQYRPPVGMPYLSNNITANFTFKILLWWFDGSASASNVVLRTTHFAAGGAVVVDHLIPSATATAPGALQVPTVVNLSVSNINVGEGVRFELIWRILSLGSGGSSIRICQANYTQDGSIWNPNYSSLELTGLQVDLGGSVNFKLYDKFRSYKFLDLLGGLVDCFNLSIQTNPITKVVTIEPTHDYRLPDGTVYGTAYTGYFKSERLDWSGKVDYSKEATMQLFSDSERRLDFQYKLDGSDGAQNIWAARYKNINLNNITNTQLNSTNLPNGISAGVPGASRYMYSSRFQNGSKTQTNRFFSAVMHCDMHQWDYIAPGNTPQLICIYQESTGGSSSEAISASFEPKLAFYGGLRSRFSGGGWYWVGDPRSPNAHPMDYDLPFMFAVNCTDGGYSDPILSYSDFWKSSYNPYYLRGLMKTFFSKRLAMRDNGQLYKIYMNLNITDITDWEHRNTIIIKDQLYELIGIEGYNPNKDDSCLCTFWKVEEPTAETVANMYPSYDSIRNHPLVGPFDLVTAPLKVFGSDLPRLY